MRLIIVTTVSSLFLVSAAFDHTAIAHRAVPGCSAQSIQDNCTSKGQQPVSSLPFKECVAEAMTKCDNSQGAKTKRSGESCSSLQLSCSKQLGPSASTDALTACIRKINASCPAQPQPLTKRDIPSCASIQTSCSAKLGSLISRDALADCVKQVNPSCPAQSQPPTKRDDCTAKLGSLSSPGAIADCVKKSCVNDTSEECSNLGRADPVPDKRAESTCNFAVIDDACKTQLGPDATGVATSQCIRRGLKSTPACVKNIEFEPPKHKRDELTCDIDSLAKACHAHLISIPLYFACVAQKAASMNGCEEKLLAAMSG